MRLSPLEPVRTFLGGRHLHDLGKMMFAFVMIWAYVNFSQYLIVWSGNLPEEISWYLARFRGGWGALGLAVLLFHFVAAVPAAALAAGEPRTRGCSARRRRFSSSCASWTSRGSSCRPSRPARSAIHWMDLDACRSASAACGSSVYARNLAARPLLPVHDPGFEEALAHGRE